MLTLLLTPDKRAVSSIYTDSRLTIPPISIEEIAISVGLLEPIQNPTGQELWQPVDLTDWEITAALGRPFERPFAGTFSITNGANTTNEISATASAADIQQALVNAGILTSVEQISPGYFRITWTVAGVRAASTVENGALVPASDPEVKILHEGTLTTKAIQTLRLLQAPAALGTLNDYQDEVATTVTVVHTGSAGENHKVRVSFDPAPIGGTWTINLTGKSKELSANATPEEVQAALENAKYGADPIGAGNVVVTREPSGAYFVEFIGEHAQEDMGTITVTGTRLTRVPVWAGTMDTDTPAIEAMLGTEDSIPAILEITGIPPTGGPRKLYREPITVVSPILRPLL